MFFNCVHVHLFYYALLYLCIYANVFLYIFLIFYSNYVHLYTFAISDMGIRVLVHICIFAHDLLKPLVDAGWHVYICILLHIYTTAYVHFFNYYIYLINSLFKAVIIFWLINFNIYVLNVNFCYLNEALHKIIRL